MHKNEHFTLEYYHKRAFADSGTYRHKLLEKKTCFPNIGAAKLNDRCYPSADVKQLLINVTSSSFFTTATREAQVYESTQDYYGKPECVFPKVWQMVSMAQLDSMLVPRVTSARLVYCQSHYKSKNYWDKVEPPPLSLKKKRSSPHFTSRLSVSCSCLSPRGSECFPNDLQVRNRVIHKHAHGQSHKRAHRFTHTHTHLHTRIAILRDNWVIGGEAPSQHPVTIKASTISGELHKVKEQHGRVLSTLLFFFKKK